MKNQENTYIPTYRKNITPKPPTNQSNTFNQTQTYVQQLIKFVSIMPDIQKAIILIYPAYFCDPQKFFQLYPGHSKFQKNFSMYLATINQPEQTLLIGLNYDYLNLVQNNSQFKDKHLILLYLLKKIKNIKFVLCFDQESVKQSNFNNVSLTFTLLKSILRLEDIDQYKKSFITIISHESDQELIKQQYNENFQKSLRQGVKFYNQINEFTSKILKPILNEELVFFIKDDLVEQQYQQKKREFINLIKGRKYFNTQTQTGEQSKINQRYLELLLQRSKPKLNRINQDKGQTPTGQEEKSQLQQLFKNWQTYFQNFVSTIIKSIKRKKNFIKSDKQHILIQWKAKYTLQQLNTNRNVSNSQFQSIRTLKYFNFLQQFFIDSYLSCKKIKDENLHSKDIKKQLQGLRKRFYYSVYQNSILNQSIQQQKVILDYFMVFQQLLDVWSDLSSFNKMHNTIYEFFQSFKLQKDHLTDRKQIRFNLFNQVQNCCVLHLQSDFNKYQKQKSLSLKQMRSAIQQFQKIRNKIQQTKQLLSKDVSGVAVNVKLINDLNNFLALSRRFNNIVSRYQDIFKVNILTELSGKPITKIKYIINEIQNTNKTQTLIDLVQELGKTINQAINQKIIIDKTFKLVHIAIKLFMYKPMANVFEIQQAYTKIYHKIQSKYRIIKQKKGVEPYQKQILTQYIQYYFRQGLIQKARQIIYQISLIDQQLSCILLPKCFKQKQITKLHLEYAKKCLNLELTFDEKQIFKRQVKDIIGQLKQIIDQENPQTIELKFKNDDKVFQQMDI